MKWHIPPENQGQTIEIAYGDSFNGFFWKRMFDKSDGNTVYYVASANSCGCLAECSCFEPWNREPTKYRWWLAEKPE